MVFMNWSGGKDSALALYKYQQSGAAPVELLFTTISQAYQRISMHGVRRELLEQQAAELKLPLKVLELPENVDIEGYDDLMSKTLNGLTERGFDTAIYGDIFLEDLRKYREERLQEAGVKAQFPLWKRDTQELVTEFLELGFRTMVVCVDGSKLDQSFVGRELDEAFIRELPEGVDPCGENGEFHTFVFDGPIFPNPINLQVGEIVHRTYGEGKGDWNTGFWFADILTA